MILLIECVLIGAGIGVLVERFSRVNRPMVELRWGGRLLFSVTLYDRNDRDPSQGRVLALLMGERERSWVLR